MTSNDPTQVSPVEEERSRAQQLRAAQTSAERAMWRILHVGELTALNWRRQAPFQNYVLDFVSHAARLAIEIDGVQHAEPKQAAHDARRTAMLMAQGYQVLRFWNHDVLHQEDGVWVSIHATARKTKAASRMQRWRPASPSMGEAAAQSAAGGGARATSKSEPQAAEQQTSRASPPQSSLRDDSSPIEGEQSTL